MRKTGKMLTLLLVVAMLIGMVAAPPLVGLTENESAQISVMMPHFGGIPPERPVHQAWETQMSEATGKQLTFDWNFIPYGEYAEKERLAMLAGDFSDLMYVLDYVNTIPYHDQDIFVELSEYAELTPNYLAFVASVQNGMEKITNSDGLYYGFRNAEIPRLTQGLGLYYVASYRYDIFEANGIKIPETTDEFYAAAEALKKLYPESFPVIYGDFSNVFKTNGDIFWNGTAYEYGPVSQNYKDMLIYDAKLHADGLMDPESMFDDADTLTRKALNGSVFMQMNAWFTSSFTLTSNTESDAVWVNAIFPADANYGTPWQGVMNVNSPNLGGHTLVVNAESSNRELLIQLGDLQYTAETIELVTWGIENTTFVRGENGKPTFVDAIKNSENSWTAGDEYGMRASASYRPGLQLALDSAAFLDFASIDPSYINGEYVELKWEAAFPDENWPNSDWISPNLFALPITFTTDESQDNAVIMTPIKTLVEEWRAKFIRGEASLETEWDSYVSQIEGLGLQTVLDMYNAKAAELG